MRGGTDARLPPVIDRETNKRHRAHTFVPVYTEMFRQVCRDYASLPDVRTLTMHEIRFFYDGLRAELRRDSKEKNPKK